MKRLASLLLIPLAATASLASDSRSLSDSIALADYLESGETVSRTFSLTGTVTSAQHNTDGRIRIILQDSTGCAAMYCDHGLTPTAGDFVTVSGEAGTSDKREPWASARKLTVLGRKPIPPPADLSLAELDGRRHDFRQVRVSGTIVDTFPDDIAPDDHFALLKDGATTIPVNFNRHYAKAFEKLINAKVRIVGCYRRSVSGYRRFSGPFISLATLDDIEVLTPPPPDPFAVPPLETRYYQSPAEVARHGKRRITGTVTAVWLQSNLMIQSSNGITVTATLAHGITPPDCGAPVTVVGYPETDLFNLCLTRAIYKPCDNFAPSSDMPTGTTLQEMLGKSKDNGLINPTYHGKLITITASVYALPYEGSPRRRVLVKQGDLTTPVDLGQHPEIVNTLQIGATIEVTGRCLLEADRWQSNNVFTRPSGIVIIIRTPEDIRIVANPPWLNARRLMILVGILITVLIGVGSWNFALNRLVERRSRELLREQTARADASLKIDERTRLAVELHDSLSQTLTGVSFQLDAAQEARQQDPSLIGECLDAAQRTLASCREELKNCLWDLRNNALEEPNLNKAIRTTLNPHILGTEISIDCSVPRSRLSDSTFHNLLAILRELTVNAIRHGKARHVTVRGQLASRTLTFSVADDGCGFDPDSRPGMEEGHFGLLGVCERLNKLGGRMDISSVIGKGTTVSIIIECEHEEDTRANR